MTSAAIRQELHHIIDIADDERVAELYNMLQSDVKHEKYTAEELAEFYRRLEMHENGENPDFSVEEAHNYVRQNAKRK
jgi:hypothetical protein